ncbi:MAG: hypothetical protein K2M34_02015 [Alphaproteobacteria bacterium]|nr:hypothetical protein [Alphaproteobacteria bacterium]
MCLKLICLFCLIFMAPAYAVTCNMGYYNDGEQCIECEAGYFCASGVRTACSDVTNNLYPYSEPGAYDVVWCYQITTPGKYVASSHGGMIDCDTEQFCPGNVRVYYGLPDGYKMTKYTTINNDHKIRPNNFNGVNTGIVFDESDAIDFAFSTTDKADDRILFVTAYNAAGNVAKYAYIASQGGDMYATPELNATLFPVYSRAEIGDGTLKSVRAEYSNFVSNSIYFGSWVDPEWSRTIDWYGFRVLKSDSVLRNLIPCLRESDGKVGFYDTVGNEFYTNHMAGTLDFTAGDVIDKYACPHGMYYGGRGICYNCPAGLVVPDIMTGVQSVADCGRVMRFGNHKLYLRSAQRTYPCFAVQIGDYVLYGDMTLDKCGLLRTNYQGDVYSICNIDIDD